MESINEALRLIRRYHDIGQKELEDNLGLSGGYISKIEIGGCGVGLKMLNKYSKFFKMPVSSILFFSEFLAPGRTVAGKISTFNKIVGDN